MTSTTVALPPKLIPVFEGKADVRGAYGGRGSGKSRSFALMAAVRGYAHGMSGDKGIILCARQYMNSLEDSSLEEVKRAIESEPFLLDYYELGDKYIKSKDGRISFSFAGLDRNISSIKSKSRILLCWIDEAEPVTEHALSVLEPTLREEGEGWSAELWVTWNPSRKSAAVEKRYRQSDDPLIKLVELNWRDNPKFPARLERQRLRDLKERPDEYDHIWEGDFLTYVDGAYYAAQLAAAKAEGRIGKVARDPLMAIRAYVDIGGTGAKADAFAMWIAQLIGKEIRVLDYYEAQGQPLGTHVQWLRDRGYDKAHIWLPHDGVRHDNVYRVTYETALRQSGFDVTVVPNQGAGAAKQRIEALRRLFPSLWFNADTTQAGLDALAAYHEKRDEKRDIGLGPEHDWASHGCLVAGTLVATKAGDVPIENICAGDYVKTPAGDACVLWSGVTKVSQTLIEIKLSDGRTITATPEHKIFTTRGMVCADALRYNDGIFTSEVMPCISSESVKDVGYRDAFIESSTETSSGFGRSAACTSLKKGGVRGCFTESRYLMGRPEKTRKSSLLMGIGTISARAIGSSARRVQTEMSRLFTLGKNLTGAATTERVMAGTTLARGTARLSTCTALYGNITTERYQTAGTSTTSTTTPATTALRIWRLFVRRSMPAFMPRQTSGLVAKQTRSSFAQLQRRRNSGTKAMKAGRGIANTLEAVGSFVRHMMPCAKSAAESTRRTIPDAQNTVAHLVSKRRIAASELVYDLTVEKHHCYFANGILVSNSDALGMMAVVYQPPIAMKPLPMPELGIV